MAYVIAEPCIGTKDTACVDACPVDCIHPRRTRPMTTAASHSTMCPNSILTRWSASMCPVCPRSSRWTTCLPIDGGTSE